MPDDLFDLVSPSDLNKVGRLEFISRRVVDGFLTGRHASRLKGGCAEFAEHRAYSPGDEVRLLDWRVFARTDRYYIKRYEEETNLQMIAVLDTSGSMSFGMSTASKFDYSRAACACLARLFLRQTDAAGLALMTEQGMSYVPPRAHPRHLQALLNRLRQAAPYGTPSLASGLTELAKRIRRRGLLVIFSDCFEDVPSLARTLRVLGANGHETILFHVLAPEELSFSFRRWSRFACLEVEGRRVDLDPEVVRDEYLRRMQDFLAQVRHACGEAACEYFAFPTDRPLGESLAECLKRRAEQLK